MPSVVGIRFKKAGKIYYFDPEATGAKAGLNAIVETVRGLEYGEIVIGPREVPDEEIIGELKNVIRIATPQDDKRNLENLAKAKVAYDICAEKIVKHGLDMKLVDVEYTFDVNKIVFYFTAENRIDFRELVKDLAAVFRTRIELRQIGVRDEAKMLNGIGCCGRSLCCATFLGDFEPVSIRMAKDQKLSLNPVKISGICGRLMCCLKYENHLYEHNEDDAPTKCHNQFVPRIGFRVVTPQGEGQITYVNRAQKTVSVKLSEDNTFTFGWDEVVDARQVKDIV